MMDAVLRERKAECVNDIYGVCSKYLQQVEAEFAPRLDAAEEDRKQLQQVQEQSRYDARRIASLEREIAFLRSVSHYKDAAVQTILEPAISLQASHLPSKDRLAEEPHASQVVNFEEHERVKSELATTYQDLHRVHNAREVLETKYRTCKRAYRQWDNYCKLWIDKKGPRRNSQGYSREGQEGIFGQENGHNRASSAAAFLPSETRSPPESRQLRLLAETAPSSLRTTPIVRPQAAENNDPAEVHVRGQEQVQTPSPTSLSLAVEDDDPTQGPDDDDDAAEVSPHPKQEEEPQDRDSDNPIIVEIKPINALPSKRKRGQDESSVRNAPKVKRENDVPGSAAKPVHVKSDPLSSSPAAALRFQGLDDGHDSMDLDEVGSRTITPRKRQRYSFQYQPSPTAWMPSASDDDPCLRLQRHNDMLDDYGQSPDQNHVDDRSQSFILDEASCRRKCEEYAASLWRQEQERYRKRENDQISEQPARSKNITDQPSFQDMNPALDQEMSDAIFPPMDRQVDDFNRRVMEAQLGRLDRAAAPKTPKPVNRLVQSARQSHGTDTRDFGLPTPVTAVRLNTTTPGPYLKEKQIQRKENAHSVLQPRDPNNQILPRTGGQLAYEKRQCPPSQRDRGAAQIHTVLEDGEETRSRGHAKKGASKVHNQQREDGNNKPIEESSKAHYRLGTLLAEPSPERPSLPAERLDVLRRTDHRNSRTPPSDLRPQRPLPSPNAVVNSAKPSATTKARKPNTYSRKPVPAAIATFDSTSSDDPPSVQPEDEPLRSRPIQRLRREDFKINPVANQGITHQYREVIRKREDRKCLPGCNRPDCCGTAIKKLLAIGGPLPRQSRGLFQSSPPDNKASDEGYDYNVLREYMGDNYQNWIRLSDKDKSEEWNRAQTWSFSRRFGKHKATGRQPTPPGYWNVDFEGTQEAQKQREEEEKMAREEVGEKWREAMRPGGLWKFADE